MAQAVHGLGIKTGRPSHSQEVKNVEKLDPFDKISIRTVKIALHWELCLSVMAQFPRHSFSWILELNGSLHQFSLV